jgi:hypothetical protein
MLAAWLVLPLASSLRKVCVGVPPGKLLMKGLMSTPWQQQQQQEQSQTQRQGYG